MRVWDAVGKGAIKFDAKDNAGSPIAFMAQNNVLQSALANIARDQEGRVTVFNKTRVEKIVGDVHYGAWPVVHLEGGEKIRARVLIGADGVASKVRDFAKIETVGWDYPQKGIVATLKVDDSAENDTAWQRFLPTGPIALLPLGKGYSSLVWSTPANLSARLCNLPVEDFVTLVNAAFKNPVEDVEYLISQIGPDGTPQTDFKAEAEWGRERAVMHEDEVTIMFPPAVIDVEMGSRASFPLRMRNSVTYVDDRIALIGDAAHTVHPLAGQGLNIGLADAEALTSALAEGLMDGQDIGQIHVLEKYAAERYLPNLAMLTACDGIGRLFGTDARLTSWIRSAGLNITDSITPLKSVIMKYAGRISP
ncbi:putative ubiquinone biosynthesis monooxygenase [Rhizophlyctis rosea]|nr:putative ubiquinone biosynthesis monooxygenase [Rhizophlyctis rosea]